MLDFNKLSPLMEQLHADSVKLYYLMLPVFFALAVTLQWFRRGQGSIDFLDILKRTVIATLLLIAFPEISSTIISVTEGVATRIDSHQSLDKLMEIAQEKAAGYSTSPASIILQFNDMILAAITFMSFLFVSAIRYLTLAMFHFFWIFLVVNAPLLILFNLFPGTSQVVTNLFRGLIEIACWKIVWACLGVMLASLSFGQMYLVEGSYITVIIMNFIVALAMLSTPLIVHGLVGSGIHSSAPMIAYTTVAAASRMPALAMKAHRMVQGRSHFSMRSKFNPSRSKKDGHEYSYKPPKR